MLPLKLGIMKQHWIALLCAVILVAFGNNSLAQQSNDIHPKSDIGLLPMVSECLRSATRSGAQQIIVWMPVEAYQKQPKTGLQIVAPTTVFVAEYTPTATADGLIHVPKQQLFSVRDSDGNTYREF